MLGRRSLSSLEKRLGHKFKRPELLDLAVTHRSAAYEHQGGEQHYERLEFLGDAVLALIAVEWLYERHPGMPEGNLSKLKAQLVSGSVLAAYAERLELGKELKLGVGEERSGGRTKASLLADSLEAVFGAIYLDGGLEPARTAIRTMLEGSAGTSHLLTLDAKTRLQEVAQGRGWALPEYRLAAELGPDHDKRFVIECWLAGKLAGRGEGSSKKIAEQRAAAVALAGQSPA
ncbi:MAG TPA: ribonuclease III [Thermoanaerobaculia bacterium]|nr:ribonuclease III [Thermoanaerobaculia bacterium]